MKLKRKTTLLGSLLLAILLLQTFLSSAQQTNKPFTPDWNFEDQDERQIFSELLNSARSAEYSALLEKLYGDEAQAAADNFNTDTEYLIENVANTAWDKTTERLNSELEERANKRPQPIVAPKTAKPAAVKTPATKPSSTPAKKPAQSTPAKPSTPSKPRPPAKPAAKKSPLKPASFNFADAPQVLLQRIGFAFRLVNQEAESPEIKTSETDKEIKAEGSTTKNFETKDAKGTRTQKAETRYLKDGKTFGVEIKDTQVIEAVSKPDGKRFRRELSLQWGAEVAACPDANGVTEGKGKAKVISKTTYTEEGETVTMTSDFDLQAKLTGHVNDQAELTHYDLVVDAYVDNSGFEAALERNIVKEIKLKDGRYGIRYNISGNTIEISDGTYGGKRTPAKMGEATARTLTTMSESESTRIDSAFGPMVPTIWNSANEMYAAAQKNWRKSGCVSVSCTVPKLALKAGEEIEITTETVHLQDNTKVNAEMNVEAYPGQITPETQTATPRATFTFIKEGEETAYFEARSISKRGIGEGSVEFNGEKEEVPTEAGIWTGTIKVERKQREEREKRAGANLAENGGHLETITKVQLQLTGQIDRSVEANNAYIANVSGEQQHVDHEYDKYKVDEGYCGPNAVPYKGPKEITRTSTTTINYNKATRVFVEIGGNNGSITFSLPDQNGTTIHKYIHKSPCPDHDRANTNEATNEDVPGVGGSFAFSFPIDPTQKTVKGTTTVRDEDGGTTTYRWELTRR